MINQKVNMIIEEMGDMPRGGKRKTGERVIRYHHENEIRKAIKEKLIAHRILMDVKDIDVDIVASSDTSAGYKIYSTMHVKAKVKIVLIDMADNDEKEYSISAAALGDNFSNASSTAVTYAIRDWMKAKFQITYPETEETEDIPAMPMILPEDIAEDCKLIISRNLASIKKKAKKAGLKPGSWNVIKMSHEDLFRFSVMAMNEAPSKQSDVLDGVSEKLEDA